MFERLGLDAIDLAEIAAYATLEPVGEPMADYSGGRPSRPKPMDPARRRAVLRSIFGAPNKGHT